MEPRIFHGNMRPNDLAQALMGEFNRGNLRAQKLGGGRQASRYGASRHSFPGKAVIKMKHLFC